MSDERRVEVEVHYTVKLTDKELKRLLEYAESHGYEYGDPGKKETVRRILIDVGVVGVEEVLDAPDELRWVVHPVAAK
jgi:hypothetical protein